MVPAPTRQKSSTRIRGQVLPAEQSIANRHGLAIHPVFNAEQHIASKFFETRFAEGHVVPLNAHPARVVVVLSPSRTRIKSGDGKVEIADRGAGEVFWSDPNGRSTPRAA